MDIQKEPVIKPVEEKQRKRKSWLNAALSAYRRDAESSKKHYDNPEREQIGNFIGEAIANEISEIPEQDDPKKNIILSVAANVGLMEKGIQDAVGDRMKVIAGDLGKYDRVPGTIPIQADAASLPFAGESVPVIVDILGGTWHDLLLDEASKDASYTSNILNEYKRTLMDGGILIVDDWEEGKSSTSQLIDKVFGSPYIDGFGEPETYSDPDEKYQIRVYRKLPKDSQ